ncbi:MAG: hypothetical protein JSS20_11565 [Proteobacteria bacterium]|nr:hypothetical protein [Pseudomonadota bacterium]
MTLAAVDTFLAALAEPRPDSLATAFTNHLARLTVSQLPSDGQVVWRDIARLVKFDAEKPVPEKVIAAIRSWPAQRCADLVEHIRRLHAILEKRENERLEDEIRDSIRHHYL